MVVWWGLGEALFRGGMGMLRGRGARSVGEGVRWRSVTCGRGEGGGVWGRWWSMEVLLGGLNVVALSWW